MIIIKIILTITILLITLLAICLLIPPSQINHLQIFTDNINQYKNKFITKEIPEYSSTTSKDGSLIYYRKYPPLIENNSRNIAILYHGSSAHSMSMHVLAMQMSKQNIEVYTIDVRGHGKYEDKGHIKYIGQLEDDLEYLAKEIKTKNINNKKINLIGFSSGGGFVLSASSNKNISKYFDNIIAISPMISPNSPTYKQDTAWAAPSIPRIIALTILNQFKITYFNNLNVVNFAVDKNMLKETDLTSYYDFNLQQNYGMDIRDYETQIKNINIPTTVVVGEKDEVFYADKFEPMFKSLNPKIKTIILKDHGHLDITLSDEATKYISSLIQ
jgi:alpha-beta hydrolase superfamily lysophospholipase